MNTQVIENQGKQKPREKIMPNSLIFRALGDPTRIKILEAILRQERNVQEIEQFLSSQGIDVLQPGVSHHIKKLQNAHLIAFRQYGTYRYYSCPYPDLVAGILSLANVLASLPKQTLKPEEIL